MSRLENKLRMERSINDQLQASIRSLEADLSTLREENERLRKALTEISVFPADAWIEDYPEHYRRLVAIADVALNPPESGNTNT